MTVHLLASDTIRACNNEDEIDKMAWTEPHFSKPEVNEAGKALRAADGEDFPWESFEKINEYLAAVKVANNWRASHAYPLNTLQMNLRRVARRFDDKAIIAQRVKRLVSITRKLVLTPSMRLAQIQDLGGCRAIVANVKDVQSVHDYYLEASDVKHKLLKVDNYVERPKPSGYRGVHLVYEYAAEGSKAIYNGMKIEMQVRSRYQHAWATAVETVGMFSGQALKSSLGSEDWKRFFALMSSIIALREGRPVVPETPVSRIELREELREYADTLEVVRRLQEYRHALQSIAQEATGQDSFYLLQLDPASAELGVRGFRKDQSLEAELAYAEAEEGVRKFPRRDAVLVSVDSINALERAYPNYFADTRIFLQLLIQATSGRIRSIPDQARIKPSSAQS